MQGRLRQQGGAVILTVPNAIIAQMGWQAGNFVEIETQGEQVILKSHRRIPRGRKSVAELLQGIDSQEIAHFNQEVAEMALDTPEGKEIW